MAEKQLGAAPSAPTDAATVAYVIAYVAAALTALKGDAGVAMDTLGELSDALNDDPSFAATITTALAGKQAVLTATAVKTSAYTAAVSDLVPADATSAGFTVTLPSAPADKSRIVVKKIDSSANVVTVAAGGSDVFNKASGATTLTLQLQNQAVQLQYKASGAIWYVVSTDVPLSGLDTRYKYAANVQTITGAVALSSTGDNMTFINSGGSTHTSHSRGQQVSAGVPKQLRRRRHGHPAVRSDHRGQ
jgi:hypothetical protein